MTVFATPDGTPFYCGTYFPRANFIRLLQSVATAWQDQRDGVLHQGAAVVEAIGGAQAVGGAVDPAHRGAARRRGRPARQGVRRHERRLRRRAQVPAAHEPALPAAPPPAHRRRRPTWRSPGTPAEAMARGGIYDQLAGGFARYSVDGHWTVPHFEKMLYDNALLLRVYTHLWRLTGDPLARRVADETAAFLVRDLGTPEGGFASALDADTDGVEGLTYAWTPAQLDEALGARRRAVRGRPVRGDRRRARSSTARASCGSPATSTTPHPRCVQRWRDVRDRLLTARAERPQPARDDKVVAAWNGLAITALVEHASATGAVESATGGGTGGDPPGRPCTWSTAGCGGCPATERSASRPGCWRTTARSPRRSAPCTRPPARGGGSTLAGELLDAALAHFRADGGRLLRHRRRRRGAGRPAGRPDRQRDPVRPVRARGGAGRLRARCAASRATGRRPRPRWPRSRRSPTATPGSPGTRPRPARRCCRGRTRSRSWPRRRPAADDRCPRPPTGTRRPARWWSPAAPTSPACRCWPTGRCATGGRPRTSAGASSATGRSPRWTSSSASSPPDWAG